MPEDISLFEERYSRIYRFKEPVDAKTLEKLFKKHKLPFKKKTIKMLADAILKFTNGKYTVREVYRKIKTVFKQHQIGLTINDIAEIYDWLEYDDLVECIGSKEMMISEKPEATIAPIAEPIEAPTVPEVPVISNIDKGGMTIETLSGSRERVEALKQAVIDIRTDMETLKSEFESLFEELEKETSQTIPQIVNAKGKEILEEAIRRGSKKLFEKLFHINEYIEAALTSTIDGVPLVYLSKYSNEAITEGVLATCLAVVLTKSLDLPNDLNKGKVQDVTIYTTNNIIILKPFMEEYFIAFLVRKDAMLGLVLRDVDWILNELKKIIKEIVGSMGVKV